ncbi:MAG: type I-U CRISPR-associated protein Csb2 [Micropruina sp.]|uniref:type I-G CRISPR-associated protein Csb2 n=1 Tax=Micropruina sp. TaxID=2737536 RepID=UPI0039E2872A
MAICLDLFLVSDRYDAADGQDPRTAEWPPHPGRGFAALRSVADDDELFVLRELERRPPPVVHASAAISVGRSRAYVVTNTLAAGGGNLSHPGRTSGLRERRSAYPQQSRVQFVWTSDDAFDDKSVALLDALARRVPYLGRSTSVVLMGARRVDSVEAPPGLDVFEPVDDGSGDIQLRVPYAGYVDELNVLYEQGHSTWQASDGARARHWYRQVTSHESPLQGSTSASSEATVFRSAYHDLIVLRFIDRRPAGRLTPVFTAALRSMVMGQTANPLPPALHGHGYDGNPHVAYLGLPVCGSPFADGHLVGLAVAIPGMDEAERRRILRGILGPEGRGVVDLRVPGFRSEFTLEYRPDQPLPRSAADWHWTRPSKQWVTATPIVLDRYPKDGDLAAGVLQSVVLSGLPEPALVEVSTAALTSGAVHLAPRELPRRARGRLYCHARLHFDRQVAGPVLAGAGRYFGVGLFQPEASEGDRRASQ